MSERVTVTSEDGLNLVGELDVPEHPDAALVICHAHPKMGGTMKSPLLLALRDEMVERNYAVLRFNFRGIEGSEGTPTTGLEEVADARGAITFVSERLPDVPVAVAGWSFGGAVAVRAVSGRDDVSACVGIAPAAKEKPGVTAGLPGPGEIRVSCPMMMVVGANDDVTLPRDVGKWADAAGARYEEIPAANHFFWAKYEPLTSTVASFLEEVV